MACGVSASFARTQLYNFENNRHTKAYVQLAISYLVLSDLANHYSVATYHLPPIPFSYKFL